MSDIASLHHAYGLLGSAGVLITAQSLFWKRYLQKLFGLTGVAAGFNAPISGVFFAVETVLQAQGSDLRRNSGDTTPGLTIAMVLLASVLAAIVSQAGLGMVPAVKVPDYQLQSILELPLILAFGACCGLVSASFAYSNQVPKLSLIL